MRRADVPPDSPSAAMLERCPDVLAGGGSCIAGPDGAWVVPPVTGREDLLVATLSHREVRRERQNFDQAGHYARPDVTRLVVDRRRQSHRDYPGRHLHARQDGEVRVGQLAPDYALRWAGAKRCEQTQSGADKLAMRHSGFRYGQCACKPRSSSGAPACAARALASASGETAPAALPPAART